MKACPSCGTLNEDEKTFCTNCREKIEGTVLVCNYCGSIIVSSNKFCKSCGNEVKSLMPLVSDSEIEEPVPVSVNKIIPEKTQTPSKKKKLSKKLIITLSIVLPIAFIFLAVIIFLAISIFPLTPSVAKPYDNRFAADYSLSKDQKTVINRWGHPDGFLLAIDPKTNERFESWFYYIMGSEMIFVNGKFMEGNDLKLYDVSGTKDELTVYPYEFTTKATRDDIVEVLGVPTTEDNYQDGELIIMHYKKQLVITLLDNKVSGVTLFHTQPDEIK